MPRDPKDSQIDRYVSSRVLAYLGAAKSLAGRSSWYTGKLKFLAIMDVGYHTIPWVGGLGLSEIQFIVLIGFFWATTVAVEYFVMWPATIIFGKVHSEDPKRSPLRRDTQQILDEIQDND